MCFVSGHIVEGDSIVANCSFLWHTFDVAHKTGTLPRRMVDERETNEVEMPGGVEPAQPQAPNYPVDPPPRSISLQVFYGDNQKDRQPLLFIEDRIVVGRDDEQDLPVDLDFSLYDAHENGVSRYHAAFTRSKTGIFIEDTGSTNGTRINGFQLEPNRPYLLRNGDEIEFGRLRTVIRFMR